MAKKTTKTNEIDYSDTRNSIELYLAKAIGENVTLPDTDNERILVYLRKLIEVIEQGGGTEVIANPTLIGTEADLTGLEVNGVKYKAVVAKLYKHNISMRSTTESGDLAELYFSLYSTKSTSYDFDELLSIFINDGATYGNYIYTSVTGYARSSGSSKNVHVLKYSIALDKLTTTYGDVSIEKSRTTIVDAVTQIL